MWSRILTEVEVQQLYNNGDGLSYSNGFYGEEPINYFSVYAHDSLTLETINSFTAEVSDGFTTQNYATINGEVITFYELNNGFLDVTINSDGYETYFVTHDTVTNLNASLTSVIPSLISNIPTQTIVLNIPSTLYLDSFVSYSSRYEIQVYEFNTDINGTGVTLGESTGVYSLQNNFFNVTLDGSQIITRGINVPHNFSIGVTAYDVNNNPFELQRYDVRSVELPDSSLGFTFQTSDAKFWLFVMIGALLVIGTVMLRGYYIGYLGALFFLYYSIQFMSSAYYLPVVYPIVMLMTAVILLAVEMQNP